MKIIHTADLHFRGGEPLDVLRRAWDGLLNYAERVDADVINIPGDIFEFHNVLDPRNRQTSTGSIINAFWEPLRQWMNKGVTRFANQDYYGREVLMGLGNHDDPGPGQEHALAMFRGQRNVHVIDKPQIITKTERGGGHRVYFFCLPWFTRARFNGDQCAFEQYVDAQLRDFQRKRAEWQRPQDFSILTGHAEITGAKNRYMVIPEGSTFTFSPAELDAVGCDLKAFGHYHLGQMDTYIGALIQNNHGEEGNRTGFLLTDTVERTTVHVPIRTRRFFTFDAAKYEGWQRGEDFGLEPGDRVKLRAVAGEVKLPLPEGWTLDPIITKAVRIQRSEAQTEMTDNQLLQMYMEANPKLSLKPRGFVGKTEVSAGDGAELVIDFSKATSDLAVPVGSKTGSLHAIHAVEARQIGSLDMRVELPEAQIAVSGATGSGKTYLTETMFAVWHGFYPFRSGSLYSKAFYGFEGQAKIGGEWTSDGVRYRAERLINVGSRTQECNLFEDDVLIAGGPSHTKEYEARVRSIVGDPQRMLATVMQTQQREGDLLDASKPKRKEFFRTFLDLERFAGYAQSLNDYAQLERQRWTDLDKEILLNIRIALGGSNVGKPGPYLTRDFAGIPCFEFPEEPLSSEVLSSFLAARDTMETLTSEVDVARYEARDARLAWQAEGILDDSTLKAAEAITKSTWEQAKKNLDVANAGMAKADRAMVAANKAAWAREEIVEAIEYEKKALTILSDYELAKEAYDAATSDVSRMRGEVASKRAKDTEAIAVLERTIKSCQKAKDGLKSVGCAANPLPCPFINDALLKSGRLAQAESDLENYGDGPYASYIQNIEAEIVRVLGDRPDIGDGVQIRRNYTDARDKVRTLTLQLEAGGDPGACSIDYCDRKRWAVECAGLMTVAEGRWLASKKALEDFQLGMKIDSPLKRIHAEAEERVRSLERTLHAATLAVGVAKATLDSAEEAEGNLQALEFELREVCEPRVCRLAYLQKAFGSDGIPQLLIDQAIGRLNDILAQVCEGQELQIDISTQREKQDGEMAEDITIMITGRHGRMAFEDYSGGQRDLVRSIFRIAVAIWQSERSGGRYGVLILDEAFDKLGADASRLMDILNQHRERFTQIILTSHDEATLFSVPDRINLVLDGLTTTATATGGRIAIG